MYNMPVEIAFEVLHNQYYKEDDMPESQVIIARAWVEKMTWYADELIRQKKVKWWELLYYEDE